MARPRATEWQPGQPRPRRRMSPFAFESLIVLGAVTLLLMGAGALIGYSVANHTHHAEAATTGSEAPGIGGGRIGGAGAGNANGNSSSGGGSSSSRSSAGTSSGSTTVAATTSASATTSAQAAPAPSGGNQLAVGKQVFASAGCAGCHTLKAANASGNVGPNLDQLKPQLAAVKKQVLHGGGPMPAYQGKLSAAQIDAVSAYVAAVAGKS